MSIKNIVTTDKDILGGQAVFKGTRVPVEALFDHLEANISLEDFLDDFPTVEKQQAVALLEWTNKLINSITLDKLNEVIA